MAILSNRPNETTQAATVNTSFGVLRGRALDNGIEEYLGTPWEDPVGTAGTALLKIELIPNLIYVEGMFTLLLMFFDFS